MSIRRSRVPPASQDVRGNHAVVPPALAVVGSAGHVLSRSARSIAVADMSRIVVCGGSMIGLTTAMMLATDGHEVTVLEADSNDVPSAGPGAWESWKRSGVAQFHQPHSLLTRFRLVCDQE